MLDPVKNARVIGYLFIILGALDAISGLSNVFLLITGVLELTSGFGLIKSKRWAIYSLGALVLYKTAMILYTLSQNPSFNFGSSTNLILVAELLLFLWFFSAKDKFSQ